MAYDSASLALFPLPASASCFAVLSALATLAVQPLPAAAAQPLDLDLCQHDREVQDQGYRAWLTDLKDFGKLAPPEVRLLDWNADGPVVSRPGSPSSTDPADVRDWMRLDFPVSIPPANGPADADADAWQLELTDGSILVGQPSGGDADQLQWTLGSGADLQLLTVDLLWVRRLSRRQLPPTVDQEHDLLVLATPQGGLDRRRGWLEEIGPDGVGFLEGDVVVQHPWSRIQALQLLEEEAEESDDIGAWLHWRNGSVWAVQPLKVEGEHLVVRTPWQSRMSVPMEWVAALDRRRGSFRELAERAPSAVTSPPSMVLDWTPKVGRTVEGRRMRLSNSQPVVGWGVKAPTRMEWQQPAAGVFTCWVGVDLEVMNHRQRAPLEFRVLLDGVVLATSGPVEAGQAPKALRADVPQGGRLELDVQSLGGNKSGGSHGNWVLPRVWR